MTIIAAGPLKLSCYIQSSMAGTHWPVLINSTTINNEIGTSRGRAGYVAPVTHTVRITAAADQYLLFMDISVGERIRFTVDYGNNPYFVVEGTVLSQGLVPAALPGQYSYDMSVSIDFKIPYGTQIPTSSGFGWPIVSFGPITPNALRYSVAGEIAVRDPLKADIDNTAGRKLSMNDTFVRSLAQKPTGSISFLDFYNKKTPVWGSRVFKSTGNGSTLYTFVVPVGVTSISIVSVSGGGVGQGYLAGAGGALSYQNNIKVTPLETIYVFIGKPGHGSNTISGDSWVGVVRQVVYDTYGKISTSLGGRIYAFAPGPYEGLPFGWTGSGFSGVMNLYCHSLPGYYRVGTFFEPGTPQYFYVDNTMSWKGGTGVIGCGCAPWPNGGGGAGGYAGLGGNGGQGFTSATAGAGGSGAGGQSGRFIGSVVNGGGGGGVGLYGGTTSGVVIGAAGSGTGGGGGGGSGYCGASNGCGSMGIGGYFGGGGAVAGLLNGSVGKGGHGAVRIVWPGESRQFPSTNVSCKTNELDLLS